MNEDEQMKQNANNEVKTHAVSDPIGCELLLDVETEKHFMRNVSIHTEPMVPRPPVSIATTIYFTNKKML